MPNRYILYCFLIPCLASAQPGVESDSVVMNRKTYRGDISGSYVTERNWWTDVQQYVTLKGLAEARFRKRYADGRQYEHFIHTQIGYAAFRDSIWLKDADVFRVQLRWISEGKRKTRQTWSLRFNTQWLSTWRYTETGRAWTAGFMNPSGLELGYAYSREFLENSSLMIHPAALQVRVIPNKMPMADGSEHPSVKAKHANIYSRYGCGVSLNMEETFYNDVILLSHQSHFFANAVSSRQIQLDCTTRICFRFLKYLQLRLETILNYDPEQSLRLQYRQEVLLGIFYECRK